MKKNHSCGIHKGCRSKSASERPEEVRIDRPAATINDFISMLLKEGAHLQRQEEGKNRLPFVGKVRLISHQHDNDITSPLRSHIVNPFCGLLEGVDI